MSKMLRQLRLLADLVFVLIIGHRPFLSDIEEIVRQIRFDNDLLLIKRP